MNKQKNKISQNNEKWKTKMYIKMIQSRRINRYVNGFKKFKNNFEFSVFRKFSKKRKT